MSTPKLTTETANMVVKEMCMAAADAIKLQCGREYVFSGEAQHVEFYIYIAVILLVPFLIWFTYALVLLGIKQL